jgi:hypothetical protein
MATESAYSLAMDFSSVLASLGEDHGDEPAVILRLSLLAADEATGEPRLVSSFVRRSSMPAVLASPNVGIALELQGERRVFKPTHVTWDETHRVCIVEVEWFVADVFAAEEIEEAASWPA